jgi:hypothetical protein
MRQLEEEEKDDNYRTVYHIKREEDRLRTKPAKSSACLRSNGLRAKVSARLSPDGLVSARLSSASLRAKSLSQQSVTNQAIENIAAFPVIRSKYLPVE